MSPGDPHPQLSSGVVEVGEVTACPVQEACGFLPTLAFLALA